MNAPTQRVLIDLGARSYPIHIGSALLGPGGPVSAAIGQSALVVSTDNPALDGHLQRLREGLDGKRIEVVRLPDGEQYKTLDTLDQVFTTLLEKRFDRRCSIIACGGGVIGDMAGYAAASYQRGVNFVQVPTTLLAQVDSSVGGKTGVNHRLGKNMIGAFHQPGAVIADLDVLQTLPRRELVAGLAEVIKYGLILDETFLDWLENHLEAILELDETALTYAIRRSCEIKAQIVAEDEHEHGRRALLNLGHTFGHAIEAALGYGEWLHGEAVGAGMAMALDLSVRLGRIDGAEHERGRVLIERAGLPVLAPPDCTADTLLDYMRRDKKVQDGVLRLIVLDALGYATIDDRVSESMLRDTLAAHGAG